MPHAMPLTDEDKAEAIHVLFDLYRKVGDADYIGEAISQTEHACQAGMLAELEDASPEVCVGAFLHDVGHLLEFNESLMSPGVVELMGDVGVANHENLGADLALAAGLPESTAEIIRNHILAKRWLVTTRPDYFNKLTEASKETLKYQGGKLSEEEQKAFESAPLFKAHVRMRQWDEAAKDGSDRMKRIVAEKYNVDHFEQMAKSLVGR